MERIIKRGFASDNNSGAHPAVLQAMADANAGHEIAYGDDYFTARAIEKIKEYFGSEIEVFFVFNGTGANVLSLKNITESFNSIICAETSHINEDECGAPEKFTGCKLLPVKTENGKLTIEKIKKHMYGIGFEHHSQPKVISITQVTELGTVYTIEEIRELSNYAHENDMYLHMDGARLSNAAVSLELGFKEFTADAGVDVLSFGLTKNGAVNAEAIIFFDKKLAENFKYYRKQGMQLGSKMRFMAVQFEALLSNDIWKKNAAHANRMAKLLSEKIAEIPQIKITQKVEANGVFAIVSAEIIPKLQKEFFFYMWDEHRSEVRWMTSFDTTEEDIEQFVALIKKLLDLT
ncbi:MAG: low specificity L-threonine aldolase [Candidatus Cloacimonadales bacterium]|nr:low specificity L-threonine aldolase [Candidatus Cloacimonadales bacterium]